MFQTMKSICSKTIGFVTDIEGNYDFWQRYLAISNVLYKNHDGVIKLKHNCEFVYGGDICDRGPGDLRVVDDMIKLKKMYPNRVHLILGNRDINKLRLYVELHKTRLNRSGKCYWINKESKVNESASERLKWILNETMGAPQAFEYRRQELIDLHRPHNDNDVTQSFIDSVSPTGSLTEYLSYGKIVHIDGDVIFVHGALRGYNVGWVPPSATKVKNSNRQGSCFGHMVTNPHDWAKEINEFAQNEINDYIKNIDSFIHDSLEQQSITTEQSGDNFHSMSKGNGYWANDGGYDHYQPGSRLMQYGMGWLKDKSVNRSVIYASYIGTATLTTPAPSPASSPIPSREVSPIKEKKQKQSIKTLEADDDDETCFPVSPIGANVNDIKSNEPNRFKSSQFIRLNNQCGISETISNSNQSIQPPVTPTATPVVPPIYEKIVTRSRNHSEVSINSNVSCHNHTSGEELGLDPEVGIFLATKSQRSNINITTSDSFINTTLPPCITKIVVGHIPRGDAPLVLDNGCGLQVIHGDTSYAANVVWEDTLSPSQKLLSPQYQSSDLEIRNNDDNAVYEDLTTKANSHDKLNTLPDYPVNSTRGQAVAEILFQSIENPNNEQNTQQQPFSYQAFIHGRLSNGFDYSISLAPSGCSYIGQKTHDGWIVKATGIRCRVITPSSLYGASSTSNSANTTDTVCLTELAKNMLMATTPREEITCRSSSNSNTDTEDSSDDSVSLVNHEGSAGLATTTTTTTTMDHITNNEEKEYCLISLTEGFTVKNKFILQSDLMKIFANRNNLLV